MFREHAGSSRRSPPCRSHHVRAAMLALLAIGIGVAIADPVHAIPDPPCPQPCIRDPLFDRELAQIYTLGTFNMAGGAKEHGDDHATADALSKSITSRGADIVFLQEACKNMSDRLQRDLAPHGYEVKFKKTTDKACFDDHARFRNDDKRHGSAFGVGIVYRWGKFPIAAAVPHPLASGKFEKRTMLCLNIVSPRRMTACTAHLTANKGKDREASRRQQTEAIRRILAPELATNHAVFLGGDLNTTPNEWALDPLWDPVYGRGATGSFIEVDSGPSQENPRPLRFSGDNTQGGLFARKIDYIFVHGVAVTRGEVGRSKFSDHRPLWAEVVRPALEPGDSGWGVRR